MYNNPFFNNRQQTADRIDNQILQLQQMKDQIMQQPIPTQPTNLTQNFQIASNNTTSMKFANSIDEVNRETVFVDTPFFSKDMSVLWIKSASGEVKSYTLAELIVKDEKDIQIEFLQAQIEELKKGMIRNESNDEIIDEPTSDEEPTGFKTSRGIKKK